MLDFSKYPSDLEVLDLSSKVLTQLPKEVLEFKCLKTLKLSFNRLESLPEWLGALTNLKNLDLSENQLHNLPESIVALTSLKGLYLSRNQLHNLPESIGALTSLEHLDLSDNQLNNLPESIDALTSLKCLDLADNKLKILPEVFFKNLLVWRKEFLFFDEGINLYNNPLSSPPKELLQEGESSLEAYENALKEGSALLKEVKVMFVGDGGAGKTSILKRMLEKCFNKDEPKTHGVRVRTKSFDDKTAYFWDFGGQDIMHATHQFFLSERCVYVLVLDGRKEEKPKYWLDMIQSVAQDAPVFILLNTKDESSVFEVQKRKLKQKYAFIEEIITVNCAPSADEGLGYFAERLRELFSNSHNPKLSFDTPIPHKWMRIKEALQTQETSYCDYKTFHSMCDDERVPKSHRKILLKLLHELGVVLHFDKNLLAEGFYVLNPKWVLDAAYKVVNSSLIKQNGGFLKREDFLKVLEACDFEECRRYEELSHETYTPQEALFILSLFEGFELGFKRGEDMLIPDLLPSEHEGFEPFRQEGLEVFYTYAFLPPSLMPQLIVQLHEEVYADVLWRKGMLLENRAKNTQASIELDSERKTLTIKVVGADKRDYFASLRNTIERLHARFNQNSLDATLYIKLHDTQTQPKPVPYEYLKQLEQAGDKEFRPESAKGMLCKKVRISEVLGSIRSSEDELFEKVLQKLEQMDETLTEALVKKVISDIKVPLGFAEVNVSNLYNRVDEFLMRMHTKFTL